MLLKASFNGLLYNVSVILNINILNILIINNNYNNNGESVISWSVERVYGVNGYVYLS